MPIKMLFSVGKIRSAAKPKENLNSPHAIARKPIVKNLF